MANGRCRLHGGKTPTKDAWHQPQWPDRNSPNAMDKLHRKLKDRERQARKREKRLAAMTLEQRTAHDNWHRARKTGSSAERARRRANQKHAAAFRKSVEEMDAREQAEQEAAQALLNEAQQPASRAHHLNAAADTTDWVGGIFG